MTNIDSKFAKLIIKIIATFFFMGYLPFIPGSIGSIIGLVIFSYAKNSIPAYAFLILFFLWLGFLLSGKAEIALKRKDSPAIIIDEIAGILLSFLFVPYNFKLIIIGFFLFRILDTLKPYPAGRVQDMHGSAGIMGDDIIAALYTNIILQVVSRIMLKL